MSQAPCSLQPILLKPKFHAVRIALLYPFDDVLVFFNGEVKVLDNGTRIEPPVTFCLRLNRSVKHQQTSARAVMHDQTMEVPIQIEYLPLLSAPAFAYLQQAFIQFSEL